MSCEPSVSYGIDNLIVEALPFSSYLSPDSRKYFITRLNVFGSVVVYAVAETVICGDKTGEDGLMSLPESGEPAANADLPDASFLEAAVALRIEDTGPSDVAASPAAAIELRQTTTSSPAPTPVITDGNADAVRKCCKMTNWGVRYSGIKHVGFKLALSVDLIAATALSKGKKAADALQKVKEKEHASSDVEVSLEVSVNIEPTYAGIIRDWHCPNPCQADSITVTPGVRVTGIYKPSIDILDVIKAGEEIRADGDFFAPVPTRLVCDCK